MVEQYEFHIELSSQQAGLWNLYTQLTFCYCMEDVTSKPLVIDTLTRGLGKLTESFPWVAGQVVKEVHEGRQDRFVIKPFESIPQLIVKDERNDFPDFKVLKESRFAQKHLDEDYLAPRKTKSIVGESDPKPVFLVQITFMTGGVILTFAAQHGTMDIVGQAETVSLLSKACHNIPFTSDELMLGNRDRRDVVPLLHKSETFPGNVDMQTEKTAQKSEISSNIAAKDLKTETEPQSISLNVWTSFSFSAISLRSLKATATNTIMSKVEFISTDDALSAFIWQCISRARLPRLNTFDHTTFARTVDVRRYLGIPASYPGNLAMKTFTRYTFQQITTGSLGVISSQLRLAVDPKTSKIAHETRAAATAYSQPSSDNAFFRPSRDLSKDIAFSSWAKVDFCWELDFNLGLGKPETVSRPTFSPPNEQPMEGVVYLMPRRPDGEIVVTMCLKEEDVERLRGDEEWMSYAEYIG